MKEASNKALSDAAATVFGSWCPAAAAKLAKVEILTKDAIASAANKTVAACGTDKKGPLGYLTGAPKQVSQERIIAQVLTANAPVRNKITEALTEAKKCGCPPSLCLFCKAAQSTPAAQQTVPST